MNENRPPITELSRRDILIAGGIAVSAALLAACIPEPDAPFTMPTLQSSELLKSVRVRYEFREGRLHIEDISIRDPLTLNTIPYNDIKVRVQEGFDEQGEPIYNSYDLKDFPGTPDDSGEIIFRYEVDGNCITVEEKYPIGSLPNGWSTEHKQFDCYEKSQIEQPTNLHQSF